MLCKLCSKEWSPILPSYSVKEMRAFKRLWVSHSVHSLLLNMDMFQHKKHMFLCPLLTKWQRRGVVEETRWWISSGSLISEYVSNMLSLRVTKVDPCPPSPRGINGALIPCPSLSGIGNHTSLQLFAAVNTGRQEVLLLLPRFPLLRKGSHWKREYCKLQEYVAQLLGDNGPKCRWNTGLSFSRFIISSKHILNYIEGWGSGLPMDVLWGGKKKMCISVHNLEGKAKGNADPARKRSSCKESYLMENLKIKFLI